MESAANTKRQATSAIKWVYTHVLHEDISPPRIRTSRTIPPVFNKEEVAFELSTLPIRYQLMGWLFYVTGLSTMRIGQYFKMIPPKAKSPLDVFGAVE